jgi:hypothetical protein
MIELTGKAGELHMTLQIIRKETGKVEEVELVGYLDPDQLAVKQAAEPETKE